MARPTAYTEDIKDEICTRIAGGESLRSICADEAMPAMSTVLLWVVNDREGFSEHYHASREAAGYAHADEALSLRFELREGTLDPQSAKVILDALKWGAERMAPKRHSSRQDINHTSDDGSMTPKPTRIELVAPSKKE
ncbi:hypothetical protein [Herbaspirillum sp.]|uniref:terminase small subunit-like protein n=1 Tax=Herbaspirillum sp. TaxID=1890675 RepID=UPI000C0B9318|nr:hypothetical protein [Herbaspirillum sp.]